MKIGDVVQFNERHKWCGCFGYIDEVKNYENDTRYMVGVPIPSNDSDSNAKTAYIFVMKSNGQLEEIGEAALMPSRDDC